MARPSSKDIKNSKLYVTNLPDHFSQDQVVEVFEQVCLCVCVCVCVRLCICACFFFSRLWWQCNGKLVFRVYAMTG